MVQKMHVHMLVVVYQLVELFLICRTNNVSNIIELMGDKGFFSFVMTCD